MKSSDNIEKRSNLSILSQSEGWRLVCEAIDDNIRRLDILINDDSAEGTANDERIYTARVLNIKQKKMLQRLKDLPKKLSEDMTDSFDAEFGQNLEELLK